MPVSVLCTTAFSEVVMVAVVTLAVGAEVSTVVVLSVVVPEELELLDDSSFSPQEIMVRLKQEIRIMNKTFFIFTSIPKVKYYWLFV